LHVGTGGKWWRGRWQCGQQRRCRNHHWGAL